MKTLTQYHMDGYLMGREHVLDFVRIEFANMRRAHPEMNEELYEREHKFFQEEAERLAKIKAEVPSS